jgi:hypothetical protein
MGSMQCRDPHRLSFDTTRTAWKTKLLEFLMLSCICCRGDVLTKPLPSIDKGDEIQTHRLMRKIYEVRQ